MGHYAQDLVPDTGGSVLEEALAAFGDVESLQHEMRDLEHRMGEAGETSSSHGPLPDVQEPSSAWTGSPSGPGLRASSSPWASRPISGASVLELSGGQKSRVMLAKAILQGQDLLLLDEPTNHLDLPSLRWLESFINDAQATVAVISHDRYFLDRIATSILEIELGRSRPTKATTPSSSRRRKPSWRSRSATSSAAGATSRSRKTTSAATSPARTPRARGRRTQLVQAPAPGEAPQGPPPHQVQLP